MSIMSAILRLLTFLLIIAVPFPPYKKGYGPGKQDWGHIEVRTGAHMFYWLHYIRDPTKVFFHHRPLVVWLQGGPGGSSTGFGNFEEIGPLFLNGTERPTSWTKHVNLLFIDNPVGAGFSYVDDYKYLTTTNDQIGKDMVSFLIAFYEKFPEFEGTPFYIYCESYGGKMAVEMAKQILAAKDKKKLSINFMGVGLIDSWISPVDSVNTWAPFLHNMGMIDEQGLTRLTEDAKKVENAVNSGEFLEATKLWRQYEMNILSETNNIDFYNILYKVRPTIFISNNRSSEFKITRQFDSEKLQKLMEGPVKSALKIPEKIVHGKQSGAVFQYLSTDFMKPVVHVVEELLNNTNLQVVVMTGNLDLIVDTPGTVDWVDKMRWKGAGDWKKASRIPVKVNGYIEGYVKNVQNFYLYWVHRAGHMIPTDNPETALEILRRSTRFDKVW